MHIILVLKDDSKISVIKAFPIVIVLSGKYQVL